MVELWFYSGRVGNCMFMHAFTRIIANTLQVKALFPKGTEITEFPVIQEESYPAKHHTDKYSWGDNFKENFKTLVNENDNMVWLIEPNFNGGKIEKYEDFITIQKVLNTPDIDRKWIVLLGNFELGENYFPYRNQLKQWFKFPKIELSKIEMWKLHPELGKDQYFIHQPYESIHPDDLVISLRLEDYTTTENLDRLLDFDYFKIILESRKFRKVYIITNPGSIGHNEQYKYLKEFYEYDPIFVRIYDKPVMSLAFGAQFNNIAISQSTYSWWLGFLSNASTIYYPIPKQGPFSLQDPNFRGTDLRIPSRDYIYVDYSTRTILPEDYFSKIDYKNSTWIES